MCVIFAKPAGIEMPNDQLIKDMWEGNSDGAGFAYTIGERVFIEKGFLTLKEFENALAGMEKRVKRDYELDLKDIPVMGHFRIGTHGPNSPQLTHPFPVAAKTKYLEALDIETDVAMAHNGIINSVNPAKTMSDTTAYIQNILVPLKYANRKFYEHPHYKTLMENTINGSRLVFLDKRSQFQFVGDWKVSEKAPGVWFSNLNHENTWNYYPGGSYHYTDEVVEIEVFELPEDAILVKNSYSQKAEEMVAYEDLDPRKTYYVDTTYGEIYYSYAKFGHKVKYKYASQDSMYDYAMLDTGDGLDYLYIPPKGVKTHKVEVFVGYGYYGYDGHCRY